VDNAGTYAEVGQELGAFIARYPNAAWASWGDYDARQLELDAGFAACPSLLEGLPHFNARKWHAGLYDNRPKSLKQTVGSLGLVWQGTYHRGIDDARNVASIVKEMLTDCLL
jgi:inhibitor of KinA sporulation pathway (predicted exonuclease)